jgi:hypothetical protein
MGVFGYDFYRQAILHVYEYSLSSRLSLRFAWCGLPTYATRVQVLCWPLFARSPCPTTLLTLGLDVVADGFFSLEYGRRGQ